MSSHIWAHAAFHEPKLQLYLWIALALIAPTLSVNILITGILLILMLGVLWLIVYTMYLWSSGSINLQFQKETTRI